MEKLFLALLLAHSLLASEVVPRDEPPRQLTLRIYTYAIVQPGILKRAQRETNRIFQRFAIETAWLHCPTSPQQLSANRACAGRSGPNHLVLKLLPESMSKRYGFQRGIFGFALPTAKARPGVTISLFFARVLDLAYYGGVGTSFEDAQALILGHMMAHEVGHLLLGPGSHSAKGIMAFPWDKKILTSMERGRLQFTAQEQAMILKEMKRRSELYQGPVNK